MQITLTDARAKELAKNLRARLPQDPGQRRTLDILAEVLGHSSYGALKVALAAEASQPAADRLPPLLQLIDRTPKVSLHDGSWIWQQFADVEHADEITRVLGLEVAVRTLASDPGESAAAFDARLDEYYEDKLPELPKLTDWQPTPPEGAGWVLAGQHEIEDGGHAALFVRAPGRDLGAGPDPRRAITAAAQLTEIAQIAESLEVFGEDEDARGKGGQIRELAQTAREGDLASGAAADAPEAVHVVIIEGDDDKFVWAALDADTAHASAASYIAETMGADADTPYEVFRAEVLGGGERTPAAPASDLTRARAIEAFLAAGTRGDLFSGARIEDLAGLEYSDLEARLSAALQAAFDAAPTADARTRRTIRVEWLDPHGNLVEGASGPIHEVLPKTARFLEAMAADGLAAHVRLHGRDRTLSDEDLVEVAPGMGTIAHPWFGYADMAWGPKGQKAFQTRFELPDWRAIDDDGEGAGPAFQVTADYFNTGVRFTFEHADGTLQEMLLENTGGRPKVNTWSEFEQDSDAIVLIERDGTVVTAGAGDTTFKFVAGGEVSPAPVPQI